MTDLISAAARSAARASAERLTAEYGPGLAAEVEEALHAPGKSQRPSQYFDPVSIGSLIVAVASLAWSIYSDQRKKTPEPSPETVTDHVRARLPDHIGVGEQEANRITEIVVTEIIQASRDPG